MVAISIIGITPLPLLPNLLFSMQVQLSRRAKNASLESSMITLCATRPTSHVTRHTSHVTRHTSHGTRHTSHGTRHTSHVTSHTSHVTRHTSHVTRHTSYVIRYTSHVTCHASHVTHISSSPLQVYLGVFLLVIIMIEMLGTFFPLPNRIHLHPSFFFVSVCNCDRHGELLVNLCNVTMWQQLSCSLASALRSLRHRELEP